MRVVAAVVWSESTQADSDQRCRLLTGFAAGTEPGDGRWSFQVIQKLDGYVIRMTPALPRRPTPADGPGAGTWMRQRGGLRSASQSPSESVVSESESLIPGEEAPAAVRQARRRFNFEPWNPRQARTDSEAAAAARASNFNARDRVSPEPGTVAQLQAASALSGVGRWRRAAAAAPALPAGKPGTHHESSSSAPSQLLKTWTVTVTTGMAAVSRDSDRDD